MKKDEKKYFLKTGLTVMINYGQSIEKMISRCELRLVILSDVEEKLSPTGIITKELGLLSFNFGLSRLKAAEWIKKYDLSSKGMILKPGKLSDLLTLGTYYPTISEAYIFALGSVSRTKEIPFLSLILGDRKMLVTVTIDDSEGYPQSVDIQTTSQGEISDYPGAEIGPQYLVEIIRS